MTNTNPATGPQIDFINKLIASRDLTPSAKNLADAFTASVAKSEASKVLASLVIDSLKPLPWKARPVAGPIGSPTPEVSPTQRLQDALQTLPTGKYAISTDAIRAAMPEIKTSGDLLFMEVKTVRGTFRRLNRLVGSPGSFSRYRVGSVDQNITIIKILAADPVKYMRDFATHYKVCGKCAAELTDPESRARQFGPDCARLLGIR